MGFPIDRESIRPLRHGDDRGEKRGKNQQGQAHSWKASPEKPGKFGVRCEAPLFKRNFSSGEWSVIPIL
jgi:hypothetical protein